MIRGMRGWMHVPTIIVGIALGLLLVPLSGVWWDWALRTFDDRYPVVTGTLRLVSADEKRVLLSFSLQKHRDCEYVRMIAYTQNDWNVRSDARIRRVDSEEVGYSRPPGNYDLGLWEVVPRDAATSVHVEALHECGGRLVKSDLGDIRL